MLPDLFKVYEKDLIEKIRNSKSPFLGLFEDYFKNATRRTLISFIQQSYDPFREYLVSLTQYPALLSTLLVVQLLEDFGEQGHFAVYPALEKVFGKTLTQAEKEKLWRGFRRACLLNLGISVSPRTSGAHYMVEEYLRQAGLPLRFVDRFTEKAILYANETGVPDTDDPESLKLWQVGLIDWLNTPFPDTARLAIERDNGCYYSQQFIRLFTDPSIDSYSLPRLQKLILKTLTERPQIPKIIKRAAIPQIALRDLEYGVLLPGGDRIEWQVIVNEETHSYTSQPDDRFIPFEAELPPSALIKNENGAKWEYTLWEDDKNNRLLVFSLPTGKFIKRASLSDNEIFLDPGTYTLLLRFNPDDNEGLEIFSETPSLYLKKIHLNPGQKITIQRGPAELVLEADDIPVVNVITEPLRGVRGNELYPAQGLEIETLIPDEMREAGVSFFLCLRSQVLGNDIIVSIPENGVKAFLIDISDTVGEWKPGVSRVLFELYRQDSKRPLVRKSIIIWNGLTHVEKRVLFCCNKMPSNLINDSCENIKEDKVLQQITYHDETNRFFKMAFNDGNRTLYFTWAVPGIFISLLSYEENDEIERSIRLGDTISINTTSRKVLNIYASEPASLQLGDFNIKADFSRIGSKKIPLASLVEYLGPGDSSLEFVNNATSETTSLVKLVSPFEVLHYETETVMGLRKIYFAVANEIQSVRISSHNLLDGKKYHTEFSINCIGEDLRDEILPGIIAKLFVSESGSCDIYFSISGWPAGFWLLNFEIRANGRWGSLTNAKGEIYADGLLISPESNARNIDEVWSVFEQNHDKEILPYVFYRIHRALLTPYAKDSWRNIFWLEKFWEKISNRLLHTDCDEKLYCEMMQLATERHEDTFMNFKIPSYNLGATFPKMFCLEKSHYSLQTDGKNTLLRCFSFFPKISDPYLLFSEIEVDPAAVFGFLNSNEVVTQKKKPQDFSFKKYKEAIKERDIEDRWRLLNDGQWVPARGDMLGPMHYRYAISRFQEIYRNNMTVDSDRIGKALGLVKHMGSQTVADYFENRRYVLLNSEIDLGLFDYDEQQPGWINDESAAERESQMYIIRFLSLFAQICRCEARNPGALDQFLSKAIEKCEYSFKDFNKTLGYLLTLGEDLFAYYLFLWELVFTADWDQPRRTYVRS
jgi:hypothetical protein